MPSPFPGMNPYLEQPDAWPTFHTDYIQQMRRQLIPALPAGYFAKTEVALILHEPSAEERQYPMRADVAVSSESGGNGSTTATAARPAAFRTVLPGVVEERHYSTEIRDRRSRRLVTVIEHLSPANKPGGSNFGAYGLKRQRVVNDGANLVEIDLLRKGGRMPLGEVPPGDYCVTVARAAEAPAAEVWPFSLRDPLPTVPVPLDGGHADLSLNLMAALHAVHDEYEYARWLYDEPAEITPPLPAEDAAWAGKLAAAAAR